MVLGLRLSIVTPKSSRLASFLIPYEDTYRAVCHSYARTLMLIRRDCIINLPFPLPSISFSEVIFVLFFLKFGQILDIVTLTFPLRKSVIHRLSDNLALISSYSPWIPDIQTIALHPYFSYP